MFRIENKRLASIVYEWFSLEPCVTWVVCTVFSVEEFEGSRKRVDARVDEGQLDIWRRWFRWMKIAEWKRESFEEEDFDSWYTLMFTSHGISRNYLKLILLIKGNFNNKFYFLDTKYIFSVSFISSQEKTTKNIFIYFFYRVYSFYLFSIVEILLE